MSEPAPNVSRNGVAAIVLAAGLASRYRVADLSIATKLVARIDGKTLVRHVAEAALASRAHPVIVVTGHAEEIVREALAGLALTFAHNPHFASGLASSLKTGVAALPDAARGALVLLADMPSVTSAILDRSIALFEANSDCAAVAPLYCGERGNPVLLAKRLFPQVAHLKGDQGARRLLEGTGKDVLEWETEDRSVAFDVDTPEGLKGGA